MPAARWSTAMRPRAESVHPHGGARGERLWLARAPGAGIGPNRRATFTRPPRRRKRQHARAAVHRWSRPPAPASPLAARRHCRPPVRTSRAASARRPARGAVGGGHATAGRERLNFFVKRPKSGGKRPCARARQLFKPMVVFHSDKLIQVLTREVVKVQWKITVGGRGLENSDEGAKEWCS